MQVTLFDAAVAAIVLGSAGIGLWRGLIREVFALSAWLVSLILAVLLGGQAAEWLALFTRSAWIKQWLGYLFVFVVSFMALSLVGRVLTQLTRMVGLGLFDRVLGGLFGVIRGTVIVVILAWLIGGTTLSQTRWWRDSLVAAPLAALTALLRSRLPAQIEQPRQAPRSAHASGAVLVG
ncbi:MAG: CvpA family protein [Casimicrobiaceae bacterium]|nr:CvpA family protein [Casimicrobiaceae bacterium]